MPADAQHPLFARFWSRVSGRVGSERQRTQLLAGLRGRVVEVGAGAGRNFALYPPGVSEVLAIEPEPYLRGLAERAAASAPVPVRVLDGLAESLPVEDAACDAAVTSLVLCSVADQAVALAEVRRVLTAAGELRFFEHVRAHHPIGVHLQSRLDSSGVWPRLGAGCHLSRDTVKSIALAGFSVSELRRIPGGPGGLGIPFVLGAALVVEQAGRPDPSAVPATRAL